MTDEVWLYIQGTDTNYSASSLGRIRNNKKNKILKSFPGRQLHRVIAETFLENPDDLKVVNHKDGDPNNNRVDNLEWVSHSQNTLHWHHLIKGVEPQENRNLTIVYLTDDNDYAVKLFKTFIKTREKKMTFNKSQAINRIISEWAEDRHLTLEVAKKIK